jgi:hypothetical protein
MRLVMALLVELAPDAAGLLGRAAMLASGFWVLIDLLAN